VSESSRGIVASAGAFAMLAFSITSRAVSREVRTRRQAPE
jgi:hypothetical protein